jgi:hypothetical protein
MTSIKRRSRHAAKHRRAPGLRRRMLAWFEASPDDDMTAEMLALKFGAKLSSVRTELCRLKAEGAIDFAMVWRLRTSPDETIESRMRRERLEQQRAERDGLAPAVEEADEKQPDLFTAG